MRSFVRLWRKNKRFNLAARDFGSVKNGWNIEDYLVKEKRKEIPAEAMQTELIVAVIQFSYPHSIDDSIEAFMDTVTLSCENLNVAIPTALTKERYADIARDVKKYNALWKTLPVEQAVEVVF